LFGVDMIRLYCGKSRSIPGLIAYRTVESMHLHHAKRKQPLA
jgi:hypothetical protein